MNKHLHTPNKHLHTPFVYPSAGRFPIFSSTPFQPIAGTEYQIGLFEIFSGFSGALRRILFFVTIFYSCAGFTDISSFCRRLWSSSSPNILNFEARQTHINPLTAVFIKSLREAGQRGWLGRDTEVRDFQKGAKDMINFLERQATAREQAVLTQYEIPLETALNQLPPIMRSLEELSDSPSVLYFQEAALSALAVFSKHLPSLLKRADPYHSGWRKINPILKNIALFNPERPYFSLYKIKRSVEQYFSLKEFNRAKYH